MLTLVKLETDPTLEVWSFLIKSNQVDELIEFHVWDNAEGIHYSWDSEQRMNPALQYFFEQEENFEKFSQFTLGIIKKLY